MPSTRTQAAAEGLPNDTHAKEALAQAYRDPDALQFAILLVLATPAQRRAAIDGLNRACERAGIPGMGTGR